MSNQPPYPPNTPPPPPPPPPPGGGNPYGQNPYGNNPYGQNPYGGNPYQQNPMGMQRDLPNATAVLVLGIISIVGCFCWGIVGLACGITALAMSSKGLREYNLNPSGFTTSSYKNMNAGKICAIIGTALSALALISLIFNLAMGRSYNYYDWNY